jgi:NTP pyrophosphatase (non-canonical NTP hydrolase)
VIDLAERQAHHKKWTKSNFGSTYHLSHHPLLGIVEEVGELSHAHLKAEQAIRGNDKSWEAQRRDAVGDIVIYLMDYCNRYNLDLEQCIMDAHAEVLNRDWVANPEDGS